MEKIAGIDRRRPLPAFATQTLQQSLDRDPIKHGTRQRGKVVLFDDTYANYFEPSIGRAAIRVLEDAGFEVVLANAGCCGRPRLSKGLVREAKQHGEQLFKKLDVFATEGLSIICLEPSCASALVDDLADLIDDSQLAKRVADQVVMIDVFLQREEVPLESDIPEVLLHGHCHQKALFGTSAIQSLFDESGTTNCDEVDSGCCGMAGSFGYEHHELSQQIGEDRLFPAARKASEDGKTIVACGISCRHQLKDCLDVEAKHFIETVRVKTNVS